MTTPTTTTNGTETAAKAAKAAKEKAAQAAKAAKAKAAQAAKVYADAQAIENAAKAKAKADKMSAAKAAREEKAAAQAATLAAIDAKGSDASHFEKVRAANIVLKADALTLSKVFRDLKAANDGKSGPNADELKKRVKAVIGKGQFPEFPAFSAVAGVRPTWSYFAALRVLASFADAATKAKAKAAKQDARAAKK